MDAEKAVKSLVSLNVYNEEDSNPSVGGGGTAATSSTEVDSAKAAEGADLPEADAAVTEAVDSAKSDTVIPVKSESSK